MTDQLKNAKMPIHFPPIYNERKLLYRSMSIHIKRAIRGKSAPAAVKAIQGIAVEFGRRKAREKANTTVLTHS